MTAPLDDQATGANMGLTSAAPPAGVLGVAGVGATVRAKLTLSALVMQTESRVSDMRENNIMMDRQILMLGGDCYEPGPTESLPEESNIHARLAQANARLAEECERLRVNLRNLSGLIGDEE